jgi:hypothetical protein
MKTLSDYLFEMRDVLLDESRMKLTDQISESRLKFGDFKSRQIIQAHLIQI